MEATCHCKSVRLTIKYKPEFLLSCNCSICHRYGALWTYSTPDQIKVECNEHKTKPYVFGKETKAFHHCENCGCVTHYVRTTAEADGRHRTAINLRMSDPDLILDLPMVQFDGLKTLKDLPRDGRKVGDMWC